MSVELQKATAFIDRLLSNPALQQNTPLQREEQIIQFLGVNSRQLYPTLASQSFFPGTSWDKIYQLLIQALYGRVNETLYPGLENIVGNLDLSFIGLLRQQNISSENLKTDLFKYLKDILKNDSARREFSGVYTGLTYRIPDKYVDQCFERKSYVHFEISKVQKLKMGSDEVKNMIKTSLLLKPAVFQFVVAPRGGGGDFFNSFKQPNFTERVFQTIQKKVVGFPDPVISSAVNSNLSFLDNNRLEATARISSIINMMCKNIRPDMKQDKGADTAQKSWLAVARRNFRFYGFDIKIIDEFYKIAAENGW
ncbi:MAG: hypothetical protein JEY99_14505 [Spirochaetales bacterium]|nr:hypothetical protein [Spirochaetales bacterium]